MELFYRRYNWLSYGLLILLTSCVSMGRISVQVSVPPQRALSDDIQSIALMNRSMNDTFANLNQDSLENLFIRKKLKLDNLMLDSLASDTTLKALGNALFESGRFDVVIPLKRNLPNSNLSVLDASPSLTLPQVKQICTEFNVDALLVMDNFYENVNTSFRVYSYDLGQEYNAFVQVGYHSNWKLYQPKEKLMIAKFEIKDTIFWQESGMTLQETYEKLPTIKEALIDGAIENGKSLANYISPGWKQEVRSYFITNNESADKAISFLKKNDWLQAEKVWMKFSTSGTASFRSQIEYNLALASEMNGNPKEAISWAKKSVQSKYSKIAEDYVRLLTSRSDNK